MSVEEFDDYDDEFEGLRAKSARRAAAYESVDVIDREQMGILDRFTPTQKMILAVFLVVDVIIIGFVLLVITGRISF
ncbi:MAG: hypothetical protein ACI9EW_002058 [Cellvibrionaceae bacterium]|jgi:hypothetical protein